MAVCASAHQTPNPSSLSVAVYDSPFSLPPPPSPPPPLRFTNGDFPGELSPGSRLLARWVRRGVCRPPASAGVVRLQGRLARSSFLGPTARRPVAPALGSSGGDPNSGLSGGWDGEVCFLDRLLDERGWRRRLLRLGGARWHLGVEAW